MRIYFFDTEAEALEYAQKNISSDRVGWHDLYVGPTQIFDGIERLCLYMGQANYVILRVDDPRVDSLRGWQDPSKPILRWGFIQLNRDEGLPWPSS